MEDWKLEYRYEEHYFLTDPDQLINTHFPDESQWQLLRNPLTLQQFEDTVKNWPLLYKLGVHHKSHTSGVVYTDEFGFVRIIIELSSFACSDAKFSGNLRTKERKKEINGIPLSQYVLQYTKRSCEIFEAYVPAPGKYQFRINSRSKKFTNENSYTNLCEYQINCTDRKPVVSGLNWSAVPPFPKSSSYYGPGMLVSELNIKPVSHNCPVVQCDGDGRAKVTFQLPPGVVGLKFSQSLYSVYDEKNAMKSNSVHTIVEQNGINLVVFHIITPACGNYCLTLFQKTSSKEDEDKLLTMFCQYLVTSTKQIDGQHYYPFPDIGEYKLGKCDPHFTDVGLDILAYSPADPELNREACVETDSNGKCFIAFSHQKPLTVSGKLLCANQFPNPKHCIMVETTGKETVFTVKVPASIPKTAPLVLMAYAEITDSEGESIPPVYKILINHSKATSVNGSALLSSPIGAWGINSNGFNNGLRFQSFSNTEPNVSVKPQKWMTNLPRRIYKGGDDVQVNISLMHPMSLKAILEPLSNALPDQQYDGLSFVQKSDFTSATVLVRLPHTGEFSVTIYGEKTGTDTLSLSGLGYIHITASQPSRCVRPFPQYFNIWNKSAKQLFSPTTGELVRNKENFVKIKLAQYSLENQQISAYQGTALFSNGACIEPIKSDGCVFEFKYMPGSGEDIVGLVVKPDPNSTSVTYVLQFKVV